MGLEESRARLDLVERDCGDLLRRVRQPCASKDRLERDVAVTPAQLEMPTHEAETLLRFARAPLRRPGTRGAHPWQAMRCG